MKTEDKNYKKSFHSLLKPRVVEMVRGEEYRVYLTANIIDHY